MKLDIEEILQKAEGISLQMRSCKVQSPVNTSIHRKLINIIRNQIASGSSDQNNQPPDVLHVFIMSI